MIKVMAKLKGLFVKTDNMIYDLSGAIGSQFKLVVDGVKTSLLSTTNNIVFDVVETYPTFEDMVKMNKDILEIREPNVPVRYAIVKGVVDDKVETTEGLVDPSYITAILDYNEWTDSYVRFKIL
jgi:hypothetical protein